MALDAYFRLVLAHLTLFRSMVDHPGFAWNSQLPSGMTKITYLTSFTNETDPVKRQAKLREYAEKVRQEFAKSPVPPPAPKTEV
jgi:hypothetical protein